MDGFRILGLVALGTDQLASNLELAVPTPTPPPASVPANGSKIPASLYIEPQNQIKDWYDTIKNFITEQGVSFALKLLAAVAIFYFGRMLARMATKLVSEVMERVGTDPILVKFGANLLYSALLITIGLASLQMLGVDVTSVTAMIAAAGFAVGLALQGSLANFAAGIMLIVFKPFGVSDEIEAGGQTGSVEEVNIFNTILRTNGNVKIIIPNGQITTGTIKNFTAQRIRLIELKVGCGYCDDLKEVKAFLDKLVRSD
ncbi:mechanosensitive ion channel domain-containing protein, partial [Zoogloea sp.]|uniref:mechanosensitive ion channel family protein n=1 Tax=Zoogloea sp. TaxID=49181 RepID=UPI001AC4D1E9